VAEECCRRFAVGDLDGFEMQINALAAALADPSQRRDIRAAARHEAERLFSPDVVCDALLKVFATVANAGRHT
jgi:glycosyltransferase involved in cell wall biosynthesis